MSIMWQWLNKPVVKNTIIYLMLLAGLTGLYNIDSRVRQDSIKSSTTFVYQQF